MYVSESKPLGQIGAQSNLDFFCDSEGLCWNMIVQMSQIVSTLFVCYIFCNVRKVLITLCWTSSHGWFSKFRECVLSAEWVLGNRTGRTSHSPWTSGSDGTYQERWAFRALWHLAVQHFEVNIQFNMSGFLFSFCFHSGTFGCVYKGRVKGLDRANPRRRLEVSVKVLQGGHCPARVKSVTHLKWIEGSIPSYVGVV